jgi:hypothetical protein
MRCCCAVISATLSPAISPSTSPRSRSIAQLPNYSLFHSQRHSQVFSLSLTFQKRFLNNRNCDVSVHCGSAEAEELSEDDFVVVNFYRFVFIENPEAEVSRHLSFLQVCSQVPHFLTKFSIRVLNLSILLLVFFFNQ